MLTAYLFDERHGKAIEDWADTVGRLKENQVLWVDLVDPSDDDERAVREGSGSKTPALATLGIARLRRWI